MRAPPNTTRTYLIYLTRQAMITKITHTIITALSVLAAFSISASGHAAEWGSIKGRFVVDGAPPKLPPLVVAKDQFCIDIKPQNKSVVVGSDGGLANAVVFLRVPRRGKVDVHPDYQALLAEPAVLDNKNCEFQPHITLVRVGQPFVIKNSDPDPVSHNTNAKLIQNGQFNTIIPVGGETKMTFSKAETLPMPVNCNIHPFMAAHILVLDHPYMAVSADDGTFEISNVPAGKHEFQLWHEGMGYMKNLKYNGGAANRQGRAELTIAGGKTLDLGDIKVPASGLK
jgi:hypothetical protein